MSALARLRSRRVVPQRSPGELDAMAAAGAVVAAALQAVHAAAVSGASTLGLDEIAESMIREAGTPQRLAVVSARRDNRPPEQWRAIRRSG